MADRGLTNLHLLKPLVALNHTDLHLAHAPNLPLLEEFSKCCFSHSGTFSSAQLNLVATPQSRGHLFKNLSRNRMSPAPDAVRGPLLLFMPSLCIPVLLLAPSTLPGINWALSQQLLDSKTGNGSFERLRSFPKTPRKGLAWDSLESPAPPRYHLKADWGAIFESSLLDHALKQGLRSLRLVAGGQQLAPKMYVGPPRAHSATPALT